MFRHSFAHSPAHAGAPKAALLPAAISTVAAAADAALLDGARS
jgi:hypothetical protein